MAQDSITTNVYIGAKAGPMVHTGLTNFNSEIAAEGVNELSTISSSVVAQFYVPFNRYSVGFDIGLQNILRNKAQQPKTSITLSQYLFQGNFGFNLLGKKLKTRLDLLVGFGVCFGTLEVISHDTITNFSQLLNGAQNKYEDVSNGNFLFVPGIKFSKFFFKEKFSHGFNISAEYNFSANGMKWSINDIPAIRQGGFQICLGYLFGFRPR